MIGINFYLAFSKEDMTVTDKEKNIILNLNLWQKSENERYIDIGVLCSDKCTDLFITFPSADIEHNIKDLHPIIKRTPSILNLIFKSNTSSRTESKDNGAYIFTFENEEDTQLLHIEDNLKLCNLVSSNTLICIPLSNLSKKNRVNNKYIRFRIKLPASFKTDIQLKQRGFQEIFTTIDVMDFRFNDPRKIGKLTDIEKNIDVFLNNKNNNKKKGNQKLYYLAQFSAIHIISIDPLRKHPIYFCDDYKLTPRILEEEWKDYFDGYDHQNYVAHHFRSNFEGEVKNTSIFFTKFESQQTTCKTYIISILVILFFGLVTEWLAKILIK